MSLEQQVTWMSPESEWGALTNYMAKDTDTERVDELDCTFDVLYPFSHGMTSQERIQATFTLS